MHLNDIHEPQQKKNMNLLTGSGTCYTRAELFGVKLRLMDVRKDLIHEQIELTGCQNSSLDLSPQRLPPHCHGTGSLQDIKNNDHFHFATGSIKRTW